MISLTKCLEKIPKTNLDSRIQQPELLFGTILVNENPFSRLYSDYLQRSYQIADHLSATEKVMLSQHLIDLLLSALTHDNLKTLTRQQTRQTAMYAQAKRVITHHLHDPLLSPTRIARKLSISVRTLHRLFEAFGETVMQYIQKERIERASLLLASPDMNHKTITDIAFSCGYNDLTHFGRTFVDHTGSTPSEWRRKSR